MRSGETWLLKWKDFSNNTVRITPEKGSNPRILRLSNKVVAMLNALPRRNEYVFRNGLLNHFVDGFRQQRRRTATKLENPRIDQISFRTLRHFKVTMEYSRTKSILHVMEILGHKSIENTMVYTHLVDFGNDEYVSQVAKTSEETRQLVETGFE